MGKAIFTAVVLVLLAACQTAPDKPANVSTAFDGTWVGERIIETGKRCSETAIRGSIEEGLIELTLVYNGTIVSGWAVEGEPLVFRENNPDWRYVFEGSISGDRIEGTWSVNETLCTGNWYVERS